MKYTVSTVTRDPLTGATIVRRHNMRSYTLERAKSIAESVGAALVCPLGSNTPVYVANGRPL